MFNQKVLEPFGNFLHSVVFTFGTENVSAKCTVVSLFIAKLSLNSGSNIPKGISIKDYFDKLLMQNANVFTFIDILLPGTLSLSSGNDLTPMCILIADGNC